MCWIMIHSRQKHFQIIATYKHLDLMVDIRYSHVHYVIKEYGEST
jgi:hypothetical protein